jgi:hypothetical protein
VWVTNSQIVFLEIYLWRQVNRIGVYAGDGEGLWEEVMEDQAGIEFISAMFNGGKRCLENRRASLRDM